MNLKLFHPSDSSKMIKCVVYTEHGSKNRSGVVHQLHLQNKIVPHYENPSLGEKCFVRLMELYVSKLSAVAKEKDIFYCKRKVTFKADDECWYYDCPIGHNLLSHKLNDMDMYIASGLASEGIHNHSLRATGVNQLYNGGVPEKLIMERSGHLSISGVHSYERTSELQKKEVSQLMSNTTLQEMTIHNITVAESESEKEPTKSKVNILISMICMHHKSININFTK